MSAEGLTPAGSVAVIAVDRAGTVVAVPAGLELIAGRNVTDFAAPWLRVELAAWVRTAATPAPLDDAGVAFDVPGRRLSGLPLNLRATVVGTPDGRRGRDPDLVWLALQPLGGPIAPADDRPAAPPPRSGWDHVLNHDVRSSLRNAKSFTGLYRKRMVDAVAARADGDAAGLPDPTLLDTALRALANADRAMEDVVRLHRIDTDLLTVGPADVGDATVSAADAAAERLAELVADGYGELAGGLTVLGPPGGAARVRVMADEPLLTWVLAELMVNARKFAGGPTVVTVTAEQHDGWATVRVANTGRPVDAELAEAAFDLGRLLQARGVQPGVGLGLPLARRIVTRHAGRLRFVPDPEGAGTVLELDLVAAPSVSAPEPSPADAVRDLNA